MCGCVLCVYINKSNIQFKTKDLKNRTVKEIENIETECKSFTFNISSEEQNVLKDLMNNPVDKCRDCNVAATLLSDVTLTSPYNYNGNVG